MVKIYKNGKYFVTAESYDAAVVLLDLFEEYGDDISVYEIKTAP